MDYKGYRILLSNTRLLFYGTNEDGEMLDRVDGIQYQSLDDDYDTWFAVIDKDNFLCQSFDTIGEAKQYIDENEDDVPEMELKVPYIKPNNAKSEKEVA